jgi:disulfide bond formation protein DsbB
MGMPKLGKDLVRSHFVQEGSMTQIVEMIRTGRPATDPKNTTGVPMPPKGINPNLTDSNIEQIVVYLRGLAHPLSVPAGEAPAEALADLAPPVAPEPPAPAPAIAAVPAADSQPVAAVPAGALDAEAITRGKKVYGSCIACHGKDATGVKAMGKDLVHSPFAKRLTDDQLLDFIKKGRGPTDPENTTHVGMPPKGGNPALNDKQLRDLIAYIRSLQTAAN